MDIGHPFKFKSSVVINIIHVSVTFQITVKPMSAIGPTIQKILWPVQLPRRNSFLEVEKFFGPFLQNASRDLVVPFQIDRKNLVVDVYE